MKVVQQLLEIEDGSKVGAGTAAGAAAPTNSPTLSTDP